MTMLELVVSTYLKLGTMKDERLLNTSVTKKHKGCRTRGRPQLIKIGYSGLTNDQTHPYKRETRGRTRSSGPAVFCEEEYAEDTKWARGVLDRDKE